MDWQRRRAAARRRGVGKYDAAEAASYGQVQGLGWLTADEETAYLADLARVVQFAPGAAVLDVGAGTGVMCSMLCRLPGLELTALEPSASMLALLTARPELANVKAINGFCDEAQDREQFMAGAFDSIVSRQVVNGLFDPLLAFRHWRHWLKPAGTVVVIDGLYGRDGWIGRWQEEVDALPLAASQSLASTPYLLEASGFRVEAVEFMAAVNDLPTTRTPRYVVVARRPAQ